MDKFKKSEVLKLLDAEFKKDFQQGLALQNPQWSQIAMLVKSNNQMTTYGWLGQFPKMREWVSKRQIQKMQAQGMAIENKLFESTVSVPRTNIEDDDVGMFATMMQQMGQSAAELPDELVFPLLLKGKTTICYDGQNFFDTDHPVFENVDGTGAQTAQSNLTVGTDASAKPFYILDTTNVIKPLVYQERTKAEFETKFDPSKSDAVFMEDIYVWGARARGNAGFGFYQLAHRAEKTELNAKNVMAILAQMKSLKGDGGKLLNIRPSVLLVPPSLEYTARQLCEAETINGTSNILKGVLTVMVSSHIIE